MLTSRGSWNSSPEPNRALPGRCGLLGAPRGCRPLGPIGSLAEHVRDTPITVSNMGTRAVIAEHPPA